MDTRKNMIKIMFALSAILTVGFTAAYLFGINFSSDMYGFLRLTLPFCVLDLLSAGGLAAACYEYEAAKKECAVKARAKKAAAKACRESRYVIRTYSRGGVSKKQINVRGDYGLLKSA